MSNGVLNEEVRIKCTEYTPYRVRVIKRLSDVKSKGRTEDCISSSLFIIICIQILSGSSVGREMDVSLEAVLVSVLK